MCICDKFFFFFFFFFFYVALRRGQEDTDNADGRRDRRAAGNTGRIYRNAICDVRSVEHRCTGDERRPSGKSIFLAETNYRTLSPE